MTGHIDYDALNALPWDERERRAREIADWARDLEAETATIRARALEEGVEKLGSATAVAARLGISKQAVSKARRRR